MQMLSVDEANEHFSFRRLHSQQLWVPFRTFLRFETGCGSSISSVMSPVNVESDDHLLSTGNSDECLGARGDQWSDFLQSHQTSIYTSAQLISDER